ncbi:MAG: class I SAM-dependent methyltransferase [Parachlamydiales bacterium]|nr:class I SAM-dependent methyltransferase [Parachlamydiales bacterium]
MKNQISESKMVRRLSALWAALRHPALLMQTIRIAVDFLYVSRKIKTSKIKEVKISEIIKNFEEVKFFNPFTRDGGVSYLELISICSLVKASKAKHILEIGTFEGNTTLQLALNSTNEAVVHTLDLPPGTIDTVKPTLLTDFKYITDQNKLDRKYSSHSCANKVVQHLGDSTTYDFKNFIKDNLLDFIFIDGGHSYECVRSDTEKALKVLSKNGIILWHDFTPNFQGVYKYLNELANTAKLYHISGTTMVYFKNT